MPQSLSPETVRLRAIASRFAFALIEEGARAIAVTGSVGRGNATPGSDVDFWLIGETDERSLRSHQGVSLTVMQECPRTLLNLDRLARIEVDDIWVIYDPEQRFDRLRDIYQRERAVLRQRSIDSTVVDIFRASVKSRSLPPLDALQALRDVVLLGASLEIFLRKGWRVPKDRHFAEELSPESFERLRRVLGWAPPPEVVETMRARAHELHPEVQTLWTSLGKDVAPASPSAFLAKVDAGHVAEAIHQGRRYFEDAVFAYLRSTLPGQVTLTSLVAALSPGLRELFHLLHGTSAEDALNAAQVTRIREDARGWVEHSQVRHLLGTESYLAP